MSYAPAVTEPAEITTSQEDERVKRKKMKRLVARKRHWREQAEAMRTEIIRMRAETATLLSSPSLEIARLRAEIATLRSSP
jgi:predicted  nucleic acid-binding Zn-ribbon protein